MFFIAYTFKGQVHAFAVQVIIVSHSSCRTSAILKYLCSLGLFCGHLLVLKILKCLIDDSHALFPNFQWYLIEHCKQTVKILIRHGIMGCLIWVCTVGLSPIKRTLDLYGLRSYFYNSGLELFQEVLLFKFYSISQYPFVYFIVLLTLVPLNLLHITSFENIVNPDQLASKGQLISDQINTHAVFSIFSLRICGD